jgi:hypothetical protein
VPKLTKAATEAAVVALVGAPEAEPRPPKPTAQQADEPVRDVELPLVGAPPVETLTPKLNTGPAAEDGDKLPPDAEPLLSRHAAAVWLAVCDDQITRLVNRGELDGIKMGDADGVRLKITPASVRALIERRRRRKVNP